MVPWAWTRDHVDPGADTPTGMVVADCEILVLVTHIDRDVGCRGRGV